MNQRADGQLQSNGGNDPGTDRQPVGPHLNDEVLNALVDGALTTAESAPILNHLETCPECRSTYTQLRATQAMLRALPTPLPRRAFHLGPEQTKARESIWDRLAS